MSVHKAGPGLWRIRWRVGGALGTNRQELLRGAFEQAKRREAVLRGEAAKQARRLPGERVTLTRLWERYAAIRLYAEDSSPAANQARLSASWSKFTRRTFETLFLPRWGARRVEEMRAADLVRFRNEREGEISRSTINREVAVIMAVLNFAESEELIERNPIPSRRIKPYKEQRRTRIFTPEEFGRLLSAFDDAGAWRSYRSGVRKLGPIIVNPERGTERRHGGGLLPGSQADDAYRARLRGSADVLAALLVTACRRGEILALRWRDVDHKRGVVHIGLPKTAKRGLASKTLPLVSGIKLVIERQTRGVGDAFVFQRPGGGPWEANKFSTAFSLALKLSRIEEDRASSPKAERLTIHSTRHTAETWLAQSDFAEAKRNLYLGHAGGSMADHYTHLTPSDLIPLVELLSEKAGICGKAGSVFAQVFAPENSDAAKNR